MLRACHGTVPVAALLAACARIGPADSEVQTDATAGHSGTQPSCDGVRVSGSLEPTGVRYPTGPADEYDCVDTSLAALEAACAAEFGTVGCPTLTEFVAVTHWFGDTDLRHRTLFPCDQDPGWGPDIDVAGWSKRYPSTSGSFVNFWEAKFERDTGRLYQLNRVGFTDERLLCCQGTQVRFAWYAPYSEPASYSCESYDEYTAADFGYDPHTGLGHSGR